MLFTIILAITLIALVALVFLFANDISSTDIMVIVSSVLAFALFLGSRSPKRIYSCIRPRIGGIIFGGLLFFVAFFVIPAQQFYPSDNEWNEFWSHKWTRIYCDGALVYMHLNEAEKQCHPGPESPYVMSELMLITNPIYWMILTVIPFSYPVIVGLLIVASST